jgi:hypothetical protein
VNRNDFRFLARTRLKEAKSLLAAGLPDAAYYLAGYAIECALKACVAKGTQRRDFPDKKSVDKTYTHDLNQLIDAANLRVGRIEEAKSDPAFGNNWDVVQQWSEQSRYRRHDLLEAREIVGAIGDRRHGVIPRIKRHW